MKTVNFLIVFTLMVTTTFAQGDIHISNQLIEIGIKQNNRSRTIEPSGHQFFINPQTGALLIELNLIEEKIIKAVPSNQNNQIFIIGKIPHAEILFNTKTNADHKIKLNIRVGKTVKPIEFDFNVQYQERLGIRYNTINGKTQINLKDFNLEPIEGISPLLKVHLYFQAAYL